MRTLWILCLGILLVGSGIAPGQIVINEIVYDTPGSPDDPNIMFTELYGPPGTSLAGYTLVGVNGNGGADYRTVALSGTIPADGYFVVANSANVPNVDQNLNLPGNDGIDWQNAGYDVIDCDCVELRFGTTVIDKVKYGGECATPPGCPGEGTGGPPDCVPSGGSSRSISRCPDHQDTDNNGVDWNPNCTIPTPGVTNDCPTQPCDTLFYSLSEVQRDNTDGTPVHMNAFVQVRGIATIANYVLDPSRTSFYMQDDDAGVNIFGSIGTVEVAQGDCVVVCGWVSHYNGLCEIVSSGTGNCVWDLDVVDHVAVPDPLLVTCNTIDELGEDYEGMLVRIECVTIVGGDPWPNVDTLDANITVSDGSGTCTMRIDKDTHIGGNPPPGELFNVVGIASQFDYTSPYTDYYQLLPRAYSDFSICNAAESVSELPGAFKLVGCFPNPFNAATRISFTVARRADVSIRIYDLVGREVTRALVSTPSAGDYSYTWNGTNLAGETVATGLYFVHLKAGTESASSKLLFLK